jgi:hypothetical protein
MSLGLLPQNYCYVTAAGGAVDSQKLDALRTSLEDKGYHITNIPIHSTLPPPNNNVVAAPRESGAAIAKNDLYLVGGSEILYFHRYISPAQLRQKGLKKKNRPNEPRKAQLPPMVRGDKKEVIKQAKPDGVKKKAGEDKAPIHIRRPGNRAKREKQCDAFGGESATQKFSATVQSRPRTDQEWCHLQGHGDGGANHATNLVAGSEHCNTEQLAMEVAQRKRKTEIGLKVEAYLRPGCADVADWMRYKLYKFESEAADEKGNNASGKKAKKKALKIFDHIYDAQSEGFDFNQFRILETTVERVVNKELEDTLDGYTQRRNDELNKLFPDGEYDAPSEAAPAQDASGDTVMGLRVRKPIPEYSYSSEWMLAISGWMEKQFPKGRVNPAQEDAAMPQAAAAALPANAKPSKKRG